MAALKLAISDSPLSGESSEDDEAFEPLVETQMPPLDQVNGDVTIQLPVRVVNGVGLRYEPQFIAVRVR